MGYKGVKTMFSFRQKNAQAKKRTAKNPAKLDWTWQKKYNWFPVLLVLVCTGFYIGQKDTWLPIETIQLSGQFKHINQQEIEAALQPFVGDGFFSLDIHALRQLLNAKPWTESVSIRRVWPNRINITIVEKKPVARWDDRQLLSDKAVVFTADTRAFKDLPLVYAANSNPAELLRRYYRLNRQFRTYQDTVASLKLDSRGALEIELENAMTIKVGREDVDHKIKRLFSIYETEIQPRRSKIRQLDLRYANGFAVAWKKEILKVTDEASIWSNKNV